MPRCRLTTFALVALHEHALVLDHVAVGVEGDDVGDAERLAGDHQRVCRTEPRRRRSDGLPMMISAAGRFRRNSWDWCTT